MSVGEPIIRSLPATRAAARAFRVAGPEEVPSRVGPAFDQAWDAIAAAGVTPGLPIAWYAMDATGMNCWAGFEATVDVPGLELVDLADEPVAVVVTHFGGPDKIMDAWAASSAWLEANGATASAPGREVYLSSDPADADSWVTEIQQPFTRG